jgi:hypothetical protein
VLGGEPHGKIPLDCKAATHTSCSDHDGHLQQNVFIIQKLQKNISIKTYIYMLASNRVAAPYCIPLYPPVLADLVLTLKIHTN